MKITFGVCVVCFDMLHSIFHLHSSGIRLSNKEQMIQQRNKIKLKKLIRPVYERHTATEGMKLTNPNIQAKLRDVLWGSRHWKAETPLFPF